MKLPAKILFPLAGLMAATLPATMARGAVTDVTGAGTLLWGFDATDVDADAGGVTALNNQAATGAGDAVRTSLGTGGGGQAQVQTVDTGSGLHPVIAFDGADDTCLADFGSTVTGRHQIFLVARFDEDSGESFNNYIIDGEDNSGRRPTGVRGTTGTYFTGDGGDIVTTIPVAIGEWRVFALSLGSAIQSNDIFTVTDGVTTSSFIAVTDTSGHDMTGLTVGGRTETPSAVNRFKGMIAEILVYNSDLSAADIAAVMDHLRDKFITATGPTLVPSTDVMVDDTLGTTFDSESNVVYRLQATPDLVSSNFADTGAIVFGNGAAMTLFDPAGPSASKNYRVTREPGSTEVRLVIQGRPNAVIVIPEDLPPLPGPTSHPLFIEFGLMESHAQTSAEILAHYILQSTGADLPIVTEDQVPVASNAIYVGETTLAQSRTPDVTQLDDDGFLMVVPDASSVLLRGATPQATEFAVYDFLERELGVRWLFPGALGEHIPPRDTLSVSGPGIRAEPAFRSRLFRIPGDGGSDWTRRNRAHSRIEFHHNISKLIPIAWTGPHPEYFPLIDGERYLPVQMNQQDWHLCYTAIGLVADTATLLIDNFNAYPRYPSISLGVSDGSESAYCDDGPCLAARGTGLNTFGYHHYADLYYQWCNAVVGQVVAQHPDKEFGCLAYREVGDPPSFPVHDNLVPYLTYELLQWVDPARRQAWQNQVDAWSSRAATFGHYEYMFGEAYIQIPRLYPHDLADYCRYAHAQGAAGFYAETTGSHADTVWYAGPQPYILLRLLWNPDADVDALLGDWCASAVGPAAAPHLEAYFQLWEHIWTEEVPQTAWFGTQNAIYLKFNQDGYLDAVTSGDLVIAEQHLADAAAAAPPGIQRQRADLFLAEFQQRRTDVLDARVAAANPGDAGHGTFYLSKLSSRKWLE